jgi:hypothetical protein
MFALSSADIASAATAAQSAWPKSGFPIAAKEHAIIFTNPMLQSIAWHTSMSLTMQLAGAPAGAPATDPHSHVASAVHGSSAW